MTVLVVTTATDEGGIDDVRRALERRGAPSFRFDTDEYPTSSTLVHEPANGKSRVVSAHGTLELGHVRAVWYRRCRPARHLPASIPVELRRVCVEASHLAIEGALATLEAFHLDRQDRISRANDKPLQLAVARELGLEVPRTVITNDPDAVRAFAATCTGGMVTKMVLPSTFLPDAPGAVEEGATVYTTVVSREDLEALDGLRHCPMIFQEQVPKRLEARVTVVGTRIFAAALDPAGAGVDWRRDQDRVLDSLHSIELPAEISRRLVAMLDRFGLAYGCFDLVLTPAGRWVLLELNPAGEFHFVEHRLGTPISEAIADVLVERMRR